MDIKIEFGTTPPRFIDRQAVTGSVIVAADAPLDELQGVLRARWHIDVPGRPSQSGAPVEVALQSAESGREFQIPFEFQAPPGPYTHADEVVEVSWTAEAEIRGADGQTTVASTSFAIDSREAARAHMPTDPNETVAEYRERFDGMSKAEIKREMTSNPEQMSGFAPVVKSLFGMTSDPSSEEGLRENLAELEVGTAPFDRANHPGRHALLVVFLLGVAALIGYVSGSHIPEAAHPAVVWGVRAAALALVGYAGWRAYKAARNFVAERRLGDVAMAVHPTYANRGDYLTCTLNFTPGDEVTINHIDARLKCVEFKRWREHSRRRDDDGNRRKRTRRRRKVLEEMQIPFLDEPTTFAAGESANFADMFTVAESSRHSYYYQAPWLVRWLPLTGRFHRGTTLFHEIEWLFEVHIDIDNCPDWVKEYKVIVYPGADGSQPEDRIA